MIEIDAETYVLERLEAALEKAVEELSKLGQEITALQTQNAELRQALEPFGRAARYVAFSGEFKEINAYGPSGGFARLSVDDFRKAAAALKPALPEGTQ